MNKPTMNPLCIIPFVVTARPRSEFSDVTTTYSHSSTFDDPGVLPRLLESLSALDGPISVAILVISEPAITDRAAEEAQVIANAFPLLNTIIIGAAEEQLIHQRLVQLGVGSLTKEIALRGFGAAKNLGLIVTAVFGYDVALFLDDDEVIEDPDFYEKALYGLGKLTKNNVPILAKSGFFLDEADSPLAPVERGLHNRFWSQSKAFNEVMSKALSGPRLTRSNCACGGCMALHHEAFTRVAFDPYISRGEDLDYLINLRMYGSDMWFDNQWNLRRLPMASPLRESVRFGQDMYRWIYAYRKLEYSATQIDLLQVRVASLEPYPGYFFEENLFSRIDKAIALKGLMSREQGNFIAQAKATKSDAENYAERNCGRYFDFQRIWPELMSRVADDKALQVAMAQTNDVRAQTQSSFQTYFANRLQASRENGYR